MMVPVHNCKNSSASEKVVTPILSEYHTIEGVRSVKIREMKADLELLWIAESFNGQYFALCLSKLWPIKCMICKILRKQNNESHAHTQTHTLH